ncbi:hypothetical protein GUITHDRAFT_166073 [Guillardia theta CCMP2712]|uniref:PAS domain-containing protein n=2 Tax=Guillardia theta TaxID=55529 RepID=L1IFX1_GUITC|nr:hypothetical protein GUITHDRAFT_166073 [Guillardia theta CCMP2712]EKX35143.1 hypothetical protein GUITHDRAFT_166073 [Guillardia theta CCMP2712]|eukprot:XP_005822123.1 hypothetical protein GUITHDRAFT_166073 [Guillardia theta CCMP2712]
MMTLARSSHNWDNQAATTAVSRYRNLVVVKGTVPYNFLDASSEWSEMFRWSKDALIGRSLSTLQGPMTNVQMLRNTMQACRDSPQQSCTCLLTMYDSFGETKDCCLEISYIENKQGAIFVIFFDPADSTTQPLQKDSSIAVVQGSCLPRIRYVDPCFNNIFGFDGAQVTGRTVNFLCGPKTDRSSLMSVFKLLSQSSDVTRLTLYSAQCSEVKVTVKVDKFVTNSSESAIFVLHFRLEDEAREEKLWGSLIPNKLSKMFLDGLHAHVDCNCRLFQILMIIWAQILFIFFENEQPELLSDSVCNEMVSYTRRNSNKLFLKPHFCRSFKVKRVSLSS